VLLIGSKLIRRVKSSEGAALLTPATQAQLELSRKVAKQLENVKLSDIGGVIEQCLRRDPDWVKVSKKSLLRAATSKAELALDEKSIALRKAFDLSRVGDHKAAVELINSTVNSCLDDDEKAWLLQRCAAIQHNLSPAESQKTLLAAYRLNPNVTRPLEGASYQKLSRHANAQAAAVQNYHQSSFLEATERLLYVNQLTDDLHFLTVTPDRFEDALDSVARSQRPGKIFEDRPDNLWALADGTFLIIECKNNAKTEKGIAKSDLGQLDQAVTWFESKYPATDGVPVIVHPQRSIGDGATAVSNMRVITEERLKKLRQALAEFAKSLSDPDILNSAKKVNELIAMHGFDAASFLQRYSKAPH